MAKITVSKDGPYLISGSIPLKKEIFVKGKEDCPESYKDGESFPLKDCQLCRCGRSENSPYCDGSHMEGFDGTETAKELKFKEVARTLRGPEVDLKDAEEFCSAARFCHRAGGTWTNVQKSGATAKKLAVETACNCPSGRLVAYDKKTGLPIELTFKPGISILEDPLSGVSGPLWVKGGIQIESEDGTKYEKRNRVTLCRCGKSQNKPFCDGSHIDANFNDGDESIQ